MKTRDPDCGAARSKLEYDGLAKIVKENGLMIRQVKRLAEPS